MKSREAKNIVSEYTASYASYVATSRAIPDLVDGLKPVQRRCLNSADDLKLYHDKKFLKVAKLEGQVMGDYHPHGGASPVLLAQPFNIRYPLFEGQGNFGSPDNPVAAASRYIECRLSKFSEDFYLSSADYADTSENYDGRLKEVTRYYPPIPGSLLTSASGIAVGLSTEIPPHRVADVCKSLLSYIKNPSSDACYDIMPDTCEESIIISPKKDIKRLYETGEGSIQYKAKTHYESVNNKLALVVDAFPPNYRKKSLETSYILDEVEAGNLELRNESKENIRYVFISENKDVLSQVEERLTSSVGYRFYIDNKGKISCYDLKKLYQEFIEARILYIKFKYNSLIEINQRELAYNKALIIIKSDKEFIKSILDMTSNQAIKSVMNKCDVTKDIATRVISVSLRSLMNDNINSIKDKINHLKKTIEEYQSYAEDPMSKLIKDIKDLYNEFKNEPRRSNHVDDINENIYIDYRGNKIETSPSSTFYVADQNNRYQIMNATDLMNLENIDKMIIVSTEYKYYVFYDKYGLVTVTSETMRRMDNKFKSEHLVGLIGTDDLEKLELVRDSNKRKAYLGDWSIRSRVSYIKLDDKGIKILT